MIGCLTRAGTRRRRARGSVESFRAEPPAGVGLRRYRSVEEAALLPVRSRACRSEGRQRGREGDALARHSGDERRHPRTNATVNQLLDKHFELITPERSTLATHRGYADKHIRPLIGSLPVGSLERASNETGDLQRRGSRSCCRAVRLPTRSLARAALSAMPIDGIQGSAEASEGHHEGRHPPAPGDRVRLKHHLTRCSVGEVGVGVGLG
jgi:hypothetical protein